MDIILIFFLILMNFPRLFISPRSAHRSAGIISQCPPLSGPTRRRMPAPRNLWIARVTFLRSMPILSAISCVDIYAFSITSSMIFWDVFRVVFWGVFWVVFWVVSGLGKCKKMQLPNYLKKAPRLLGTPIIAALLLRFYHFCKLQDATCFRERLSGECVGRDIGTTQMIFNHAVVRNLSPCKRKFLITLSSQGFARFHH